MNIQRDIVHILNCNPFLYEIAMDHTYRESMDCLWEGHPTMSCDGRVVTYHPGIAKWTDEERQGVIVHEWMHTGHRHHHRANDIPNINRKVWNIAADAVINPMVKVFGYTLPVGGVDYPWAASMTTEQAYWKLMKSNTDNNQKPANGMPGPMGKSDEDSDPSAYESSGTNDEAHAGAMMARLASAAKAQGKCPTGLEMTVKQWSSPKVDWRAVLREFCTKVNRDSWSYARTNQSYASRGICVPGRRGRSLGDVVIVRDTSGSLHGRQAEVSAEAFGILGELRPDRTIIIDCDERVHRVIELGPGDLPPDRSIGGGCTDFRPAFLEVESRNYSPDVMVFITDLFGEFPKDPPVYPVMWAMIASGGMRPPWGSSVEIQD